MTNRADNFNRADTASALGTPSDGGSAWVETTNGSSSQWGITSNQAYKVATAASIDFAVLDAATANATVQVTLATVNGTIGGQVARYVDAANLILSQFDGGGNLVTYKRVSGSFTAISSFAGNPTAADVLAITCDASNLITTTRNGSGASATEAANSSGTSFGLETNGAGTGGSFIFDDFSITSSAAAVDMPPSCMYWADEADPAYEVEDAAPYDFIWQAPMDVLPPILAELPESFEWEEPDLDAVYPDSWAQAPPIPDLPPETGGQYIVEDARDQPPDEEEPFGFEQAGLATLVADQIYPELGDNQLEDVDDDSSFYAAPLSADAVVTDPIYPQLADAWLEEEEPDPSFYDAPLDTPVAADQIYPELGQDPEPAEEADGFTDAPLQEDDQGAQHVEQPGDDEEVEGFSDAPLAEDAPQLAIESAEQAEPDEEVEGFADAPLADEHDLGAQHLEQPTEDDEGEGFADTPLEAPPDLSFIPPECADNQIDTPDDEAFDFWIGPTPGDVAPVAVFPLPGQVLAGVVYGPNGNDYTGTLVSTSGGVYLRRR